MLIDIVEIDNSHDFGCNIYMDTNLAGNYEFLSYQNVCIYKRAWCNINTIARVFNHIPLERAGHQHSDKICEGCITSLGVEHELKCVI